MKKFLPYLKVLSFLLVFLLAWNWRSQNALIAFLMAYSEFTLGWLFVDCASNVTLSMAGYSIVQTGSAQPSSQLASLAVLISAPVVIFIIFQNTIFERFAFGAGND